MKPIVKTALALLLLSGNAIPAFSYDYARARNNIRHDRLADDDGKPDKIQTCQGVLTKDKDEDGGLLFLEPDSISAKRSLWCSSYIANDSTLEPRKKLLDLVLTKCQLGDYCYIKGSYRGHGTFYWTNITSVKKLQRR
jgi:hypothetical protein